MKKYLGLVLVTAAALLAAAYVMACARTESALRGYFGAQTEIARIVPFFDGIVIENMTTPDLAADRIFIQGNPLRLLSRGPERIWIDRLEVENPRYFLGKKAIPNRVVEIDRLVWRGVLGEMKSLRVGHYLIRFSAENPDMAIKGRAEIRFDGKNYPAIDIEFDEARLRHGIAAAWRASGWAHLAHDGEWIVTGQADAGRLTIGALDIADPVLRVQGTWEDLRLSVTGLSGALLTPIAFDLSKESIAATYGEATRRFDRDGMDEEKLAALSEFIRQELVPKPEKTPPKPRVKEPPPPPEPETDALEIVEMVERKLPDLLHGTLFTGFHYDRALIVVEESCDLGKCWTARGQGGVFGYDVEAMPEYFLRLKDYEQSVALREILKKIDIVRLTVKGTGNAVSLLKVKGRLPDDREAYIELSLDDVK